jgi:magnesium chelatase family protein
MHLEVPRVPIEALRKGSVDGEETSLVIRSRVIAARKIAFQRQGKANAELHAKEVKALCELTDAGHKLLEQALEKFGLSHRAYHRILKVARSIADLAGSRNIEISHLSEGISYRKLDRTR